MILIILIILIIDLNLLVKNEYTWVYVSEYVSMYISEYVSMWVSKRQLRRLFFDYFFLVL